MPTRKRAREEEEGHARRRDGESRRTRHRARRVSERVLLFSARSPRASACDALQPTRSRARGDGGTRLTPGISSSTAQRLRRGMAASEKKFRQIPHWRRAKPEERKAPGSRPPSRRRRSSSRRASAPDAHLLAHLGRSRVRKRRASTRAPSSGPSVLPRRPASLPQRAPSRWLAR